MTQPVAMPNDITDLITAVQQGNYGPEPSTLYATGACWIRQSTRFPNTQHRYVNTYLLLRSGAAFGACCLERNDLSDECGEAFAGQALSELLEDSRPTVRIAALDAYLGAIRPHRQQAQAQQIGLPVGTPIERAQARDRAIAALIDIQPGQRVGLIGVVNPLVEAIRARGGECLPCDFNMEQTQWGDAVAKEMDPILTSADSIIATGMTMGNGSFDRILQIVRQRNIPCLIYAQTGSHIAPRFIGNGLTAVLAEPFPFSQFSADATTVYGYRSAIGAGE